MKKTAFVLILCSGILWGCMGLFVRVLGTIGLSAMPVVFLRALVTAVCMVLILLVYDRQLLRVRIKDFWCFLGTGIGSIVFFNFCYFRTVTLTSMSVAAVLLYTAPAIVTVLSCFLFHERFTVRKLLSLGFTFTGCVLVTGVLSEGAAVSPKGLLLGLGAGLGYALYSIFGRYALNKGYHSLTVTCYTFIVAAVATGCMTDAKWVLKTAFQSAEYGVIALLLGLCCTVLPYMMYTMGLRYVENSLASVIASVEPVTATVLGMVLYQEKLTAGGCLGIMLVIGGMAVGSLHKKETAGAEKIKEKTSAVGGKLF